MYLFSGLELFDSSDSGCSEDASSRRYVGAGDGAGLKRAKFEPGYRGQRGQDASSRRYVGAGDGAGLQRANRGQRGQQRANFMAAALAKASFPFKVNGLAAVGENS